MNKKEKFYAFSLVSLPITVQYKSLIPGISIGELLLLICIPLINWKKIASEGILKNIIFNPIFLLSFYIIFGSLFSFFIHDGSISFFDFFSRTARFLFYLFCATIISKILFNLDYGMKLYKMIGIITTIYLFLQVLIYYTTGYLLRGTITWLETTNEYYSFESQKLSLNHFFRPSSIFTEPGHYSVFIFPILIYTLFKEKNIVLSLIFTTGLFFSTSGQGIYIGILVWGIWLFSKIYVIIMARINIQAIIGIMLFILILPFVLQHEIIERSINRLWGSPTASSNIRITEGFERFSELDAISKIFGVGFGNSENFIKQNMLFISNPDYHFSYMNSVAYILFNIGIIGLLIFLIMFIYLSIRVKGFQRITLIILFVLSFVGTIFVSSTMVLYMSIILSKIDNNYDASLYKKNKINKYPG